MVKRGQIHWADLAEPQGSEPGYRRPVVIVSATKFTASRIDTVTAVILTTNQTLAKAPGNVYLPKTVTGLSKDSVANVTQLVTLDKTDLDDEPIVLLKPAIMQQIDDGLRLALDL